MSYKKENTRPKLVSSALSWLATASVASFAAFITIPAQATIVATDLTTNAACDGAALCSFAVGDRTMDVSPFKAYPNAAVGDFISYSSTRGLGVADNPDGVRIGRNATQQEALQFAVSGTPVTLRHIVVFDVDPGGVDTEVSLALFVDGVLEALLNGNGLNSLVSFDLTGVVALTSDFVGSTFAIAATVNPEAGFHVQAIEFDVPAVVIDPPVDLPLPATLGLLGIGLASLGLALRRPNRFGAADRC